ncbi:MAG: hypothetical protein IJI14_16510 [Anaerolineaceae bacterium]|nr:hypothetical protein [Anaerolineaceae bacterium]
MYKKQMKIQKIVCFLVLAASVVVFLYSLGIMTDLYDALYYTIPNKDNLDRSRVEGARIYYDMQPFNQQFLHFSIILILCAVLLFLTNTNIRRRYYISNIIAVIINAAVNVYVAIWAHAQIIGFKEQFLQINFEDLKKFAERQHTLYTESTFWFDIHIAVFAFAIIANVLLVANMIWKFQLMRQEKQLIEVGKGAVA